MKSNRRSSSAVTALALLAAAAALVSSVPGVFLGGVGDALGPDVESIRGEAVTLYGRGVYQHDSRFIGAGNRATDVVVLFAGLPLLGWSLASHRRGSTAGALLLLGTLAFFLYVYGTYAVGIAYNRVFLAYVVAFSASLFALVLLAGGLADAVGSEMRDPRRRLLGWFMLASGVVLVAVWGVPLLVSLAAGSVPPRLDTYATFVTYAIDLGVILPVSVTASILVLRGRGEGYLMAASLLVIEVLLAPLIALQTLSQVAAGEEFTVAEAIGPIGGFVVLAAVGAFVLASILRGAERAGP